MNHRHRTFPEDWARMSIPFMFSVSQKPGWFTDGPVHTLWPCNQTPLSPSVVDGRLGNASFCHVTKKAGSPIFFYILLHSSPSLLSVLFCFFVKFCSVIGYVGSDSILKFSLSRQRTKRHHPPFPPESP